jgi:hypothetical protein
MGGFVRHSRIANGVGFDTPLRGMSYLLSRLKEPSTYLGLAAIATGVGLQLDAEVVQAFAAFFIAAVGVYEVLRKG